jgi:hypothetical protein
MRNDSMLGPHAVLPPFSLFLCYTDQHKKIHHVALRHDCLEKAKAGSCVGGNVASRLPKMIVALGNVQKTAAVKRCGAMTGEKRSGQGLETLL